MRKRKKELESKVNKLLEKEDGMSVDFLELPQTDEKKSRPMKITLGLHPDYFEPGRFLREVTKSEALGHTRHELRVDNLKLLEGEAEKRPIFQKGLPDLGRVTRKIEGLKEVSHIKEAVLEPRRGLGTMGFNLTGASKERIKDISKEELESKVNRLLEKEDWISVDYLELPQTDEKKSRPMKITLGLHPDYFEPGRFLREVTKSEALGHTRHELIVDNLKFLFRTTPNG